MLPYMEHYILLFSKELLCININQLYSYSQKNNFISSLQSSCGKLYLSMNNFLIPQDKTNFGKHNNIV